MLRKLVGIVVFFLLIMTSVPMSMGCVGRVLYVGALSSSADRLMSELLVTLINERTGTNVQIRFFDDRDQLYNAMKLTDEADRVDIIVEDTSHAMSHLKRQRLVDVKQECLDEKELYAQKLDIICLKPLGFSETHTDAEHTVIATLCRRSLLSRFLSPPRILN